MVKMILILDRATITMVLKLLLKSGVEQPLLCVLSLALLRGLNRNIKKNRGWRETLHSRI